MAGTLLIWRSRLSKKLQGKVVYTTVTLQSLQYLFYYRFSLHHLASEDFPILSSDKVQEVMECLFQLTAYTYPETITLPADYTPPSMAIATAYWKAWSILGENCQKCMGNGKKSYGSAGKK